MCTQKALMAQDNILQKDGSSMDVKVLEVGLEKVRYKRFDNLDGPTYSIDKSKIFMIRYENGTKDVFSPIPQIAVPKEIVPEEEEKKVLFALVFRKK